MSESPAALCCLVAPSFWLTLSGFLRSASEGFTGAPAALLVAAEHWRSRALVTGFPFVFDPKTSASRGGAHVSVGRSRRLHISWSRWQFSNFTGRLHWGGNVSSSRGVLLEEPRAGHPILLLFYPKKQDAETSASKGGTHASVGHAHRLHLSQSRWQLLCTRKKRHEIRLTFDLRSDWSNYLRSRLKRTPGIVLG